MMKKLIIFDLDGTILDTSIDLANALNFALKKYDKNTYSVDEVINMTGNGMKNLLKEAMGKENDNIYEQAYLDFKNYYNEFPYNYTKPYEGVLETLKDLKLKGYKLAVISNKVDSTTNVIINHFFNGIFDYVTGSKENVPLKPDPTCVDLCLKQLNIKKEETLYVGDSLVDFNTAKNSNIDHMGVTYGFRSKEDLIKGGVINLEDSIKAIYKYL